MNAQEYIEKIEKDIKTDLIGQEYDTFLQLIIGHLGADFCLEAGEIMNDPKTEARETDVDQFVIRIFSDQHKKWTEVAERFEWLPKDGFLNIVSHVFSNVNLLTLWVEFKLYENR